MNTFLQNPLWNLIVSAIVGGIIGFVISRVFDKPFERWQRKTAYWWRGLISRFRKSSSVSPAQYEYRVGSWRVGWFVIEGSSSDPYTPHNVICQFDPAPLVLPPDRQQKKDQIEEVQTQIEKKRGSREYHNGPTLALAGFRRGQIGEMEEPLLILKFRPSDYYNFLATQISLDEPVLIEQEKTITVRDKHLRNISYEKPIAEFASAISVNLNVITSDGFILISKRAESTGGYPGYIFPAVNEIINPHADRSASSTISLLITAQRGASHELNIEITEDELVFFTLGVDTRWLFYGVTGLIRSKTFSRDDILSRRSLGSKERWESPELYFLPHDPVSISKFIRETSRTEKWAPIGVVCLVQTMILEFGETVTERALRKYPPPRSGWQ